MSSSYEVEAAQYLPPHGSGVAGDLRAAQTTALTTTSTGATQCLPTTPMPPSGCFITWLADAACYVRFGDSTVGSAVPGDWIMPANVPFSWRHPPTDTHFTARTVTGTGNIIRFKSCP